MGNLEKQRGAVSLFAVIFGSLMLTILTVGFIKLMITDQQRATDNDLSQSAYDAALAGVEDAKRVVRAAQAGNPLAIRVLSQPAHCNMVAQSGVVNGSTSGETIIQTGTRAGKSFGQAYTCVKIHPNSPDFIYKALEDKSQIVPLRATRDFNKIIIEWYKRDDESNSNMGQAANVNRNVSLNNLPQKSKWVTDSGTNNVPPLMRAQLINPGASTPDLLSQLDKTGNTFFLWPRVMATSPVSPTNLSTALPRATDGRHTSNQPSTVSCSRVFEFSNEYSCRAIIDVGVISRADSASAFLRLNSIYKGSSVRVVLQNSSGDTVEFEGVQPVVDSTGRAADLFRRVEARLRIGDDFKYPDNAVELLNNLCKDFIVSRKSATKGICKP